MMIIEENRKFAIWEGSLNGRKYRVVWKKGWPNIEYSMDVDHVGQPRWRDADNLPPNDLMCVLAAALAAKIEKMIVSAVPVPLPGLGLGAMAGGPVVVGNGTATRAVCNDRTDPACERSIDVPSGVDPDTYLSDADWHVEGDVTYCPACRDADEDEGDEGDEEKP